MKKVSILVLMAALLLLNTTPTFANYSFRANAGMHLATMEFEQFFNPEAKERSLTLWQVIVTGQMEPTDDLLLLIKHGVGLGSKIDGKTLCKNQDMDQTLTQASLLYQFYAIDQLAIYGGLGYHFVEDNYKNLITNGEKTVTFARVTGSGFTAASQVNFNVSDKLMIKANIFAAPWYNWSFTSSPLEGSTKGSNYSYNLVAEYDLFDQLSVQLGYNGSRSRIGEIKGTEMSIPTTKFTTDSIQLGVTYRF